MSATFDLYARSNQTFNLNVNWQSGGLPVNLLGWSGRLQLRQTAGSPICILDLNTNNGGVTLVGTSGSIAIRAVQAQLLKIGPGEYMYDLQLTSPGGDNYAILEGVFTLTSGVSVDQAVGSSSVTWNNYSGGQSLLYMSPNHLLGRFSPGVGPTEAVNLGSDFGLDENGTLRLQQSRGVVHLTPAENSTNQIVDSCGVLMLMGNAKAFSLYLPVKPFDGQTLLIAQDLANSNLGGSTAYLYAQNQAFSPLPIATPGVTSSAGLYLQMSKSYEFMWTESSATWTQIVR